MRDEALLAASRPTPRPRNDTQHSGTEPEPTARTSHDFFAAILVRRPRAPLDPETAAIVQWARTEAARWVATGRASPDAHDRLAYRFLYRALRERAIAADPEMGAPAGPRWQKALWATCGLRHRQRATMALYYCASLSLDDVAKVIGVGATEARRVIESAVTQVVRTIGEPVDVRRSLRIAAARCIASEPRRVTTLPGSDPVVRLPRAVVRRWTTPPGMRRWITAPVPNGDLHDRLVVAGHRFPEPRVEPVPRARLARLSPVEVLLADVHARPADMGPDMGPEPAEPAAPSVVEPARTADIVPMPRHTARRAAVPGAEARARRVALAVAAALVVVGILVPASGGERIGDVPRVPSAPVSTVAPASDAVRVLGRTTVMVEPGDTLWSIAERELGDGFRWRALWRLNRNRSMRAGEPFVDPSLIRPQWLLRMPRR